MKTKLEIINAALLETGNQMLQSLGAGDKPEIEAMAELAWCAALESELEGYHYAFARASLNLTEVGEGGYGFPLSFTLPDEVLMVRDIFDPFEDCHTCGCPTLHHTDWEESDGVLYVNDCRIRWKRSCEEEGIWIDYTKRDPEPCRMSANFRNGLKYRLAATFTRGINQEDADAERYDFMATEKFRMAKLRSDRRYSRGKLNRKCSRLVRARMGEKGMKYGA